MLQRFFQILFLIVFVGAFSSCEEKYMDTKDAGAKYLDKVTGDSIYILADGLKYKPYYEDKTDWPKPPTYIQYVYLNYTVMFINGDTLATSYVAADSTTTTLAYYYLLTDGVREAIRKMRIGSKWRIWVPYNLGYDSEGSDGTDPLTGGNPVDPYTALIYDIELVNAWEE